MRHQNADLFFQISLDAPTNNDSSTCALILGRLPLEQMLRHFDVYGRQWIIQQIDVRLPVQRSRQVHSRLLTLTDEKDASSMKLRFVDDSPRRASRLDRRPVCSRRSLAVESPTRNKNGHVRQPRRRFAYCVQNSRASHSTKQLRIVRLAKHNVVLHRRREDPCRRSSRCSCLVFEHSQDSCGT